MYWLVHRERLRFHSRPTHADQPVVPRHPGGREIAMPWIDENRHSAQSLLFIGRRGRENSVE
jgi:hypothetical protein